MELDPILADETPTTYPTRAQAVDSAALYEAVNALIGTHEQMAGLWRRGILPHHTEFARTHNESRAALARVNSLAGKLGERRAAEQEGAK